MDLYVLVEVFLGIFLITGIFLALSLRSTYKYLQSSLDQAMIEMVKAVTSHLGLKEEHLERERKLYEHSEKLVNAIVEMQGAAVKWSKEELEAYEAERKKILEKMEKLEEKSARPAPPSLSWPGWEDSA